MITRWAKKAYLSRETKGSLVANSPNSLRKKKLVQKQSWAKQVKKHVISCLGGTMPLCTGGMDVDCW